MKNKTCEECIYKYQCYKEYMDAAFNESMRGTCNRLQIGAVFFYSEKILGYGHNHQPGNKSCDKDGHILNSEGGCIGTIHAEQDALLDCLKRGNIPIRCNLCTTHMPCYYCSKMLVELFVPVVVYLHDYVSKSGYGSGEELLRQHDVKLIKLI